MCGGHRACSVCMCGRMPAWQIPEWELPCQRLCTPEIHCILSNSLCEVVLIYIPSSKAPGAPCPILLFNRPACMLKALFVLFCSHLIRNWWYLCVLIHISFIVFIYLGQLYFLSSEFLLILVVNISIGFFLRKLFIGAPHILGKGNFCDCNSFWVCQCPFDFAYLGFYLVKHLTMF